MFSLDNFYNVLYNNLLKPCNINYTFDSNKKPDISSCCITDGIRASVEFADQEPLLENVALANYNEFLAMSCVQDTHSSPGDSLKYPYIFYTILANSEVSECKNNFIKLHNLKDWYFFSHGFIALDWFRDAQYLLVDKTSSFDKVFIMYNNLITKDRSYRLGIVADLISRGLKDRGMISLPLFDHYHGNYINEVFDTNSMLDKEHKRLVLNTIDKLKEPLVIDSVSTNGNYSAKLKLEENQRAFWHIVSETNFYHPKLHLTEKIFKPIVSYRPFILASYAGNLKYLRSYGFKTFGDFIDESYDDEIDNNKRMTMIVDEIEKLCNLTAEQQREMFDKIKPILEHNFNHFFGRFKKVIVDEMVYGFGECIDGLIDDSAIDYAAVAAKLAA